MKYNRISRRMFLESAGKTAMAIPFLPSLLPTEANAAAGSAPSKYIHISSNASLYRMVTAPLQVGPYPSYPQVQGSSPNAVPWLQKDADTKYQSLQDIVNYQGKVSWLIDEKFNPYVNRMLLVSNAHAYMRDNRHSTSVNTCGSVGPGSVGGGDIYGPLDNHSYSVDFLIYQALQRMSPSALGAIRLNLMENPGGYDSYCFGVLNGMAKRLPMMMSVDELKLKISNAMGGQVPAAPAAVNARKLTIDSVLEDFKSLMGHRRISSVDKQRLGNAAELWYSIDRKLASAPTTSPMTCAAPNFPSTGSDWGSRHRLAMDIIALSMSCGVTRNVSYTLLQAGDDNNDQGQIHGWEHDPRPAGSDVTIDSPYFSGCLRWRADKVLYLISKLDSLRDETGQSLLNSSLVTWSAQFTYLGHAMLGHNLLAFGGANGRLDTGWHVDAGAAPINRFHLTNMLAMGLSMSDIEKSGEPGFGEISQNYDTGTDGKTMITAEGDYDNRRIYDTTKIGYYAQDSERRKPFPYLKL
jgi:hypothetical protein